MLAIPITIPWPALSANWGVSVTLRMILLAPLINADCYVGCAFTYAFCDWSFRLRYFHISSHIGDEYLLDHPDFDRYNPSSETLDFFVSNQLTDEIRWYAGGGFVLILNDTIQDKAFLAPFPLPQYTERT